MTSFSDETRLSLAAASRSTTPDPAVVKIRDQIRQRESGLLGGRSTHEEYLRTCGAIEGLRFALRVLGQEEHRA